MISEASPKCNGQVVSQLEHQERRGGEGKKELSPPVPVSRSLIQTGA